MKIFSIAILFLMMVSPYAYSDSISLYLENDALGGGSDRYYTNGLRLSWYRDKDGFIIGQNIYSPPTIDDPYDPNQRPFAGYTYAGYVFNWDYGITEFDIGAVGPWSGSEQTQKWFHSLVGSGDPLWDNQLSNSVTIQASHKYIWGYNVFYYNDWQTVINPYVGASLGYINISSQLGSTIRIGYNIPRYQILAPVIIPSGITMNNDFFVCLTGTVEVRGVAYNIFLDGELEDGTTPNITKYPVVADIIVGLSVGAYGIELQYNMVWRTREYTSQEHSSRYGSVQITTTF